MEKNKSVFRAETEKLKKENMMLQRKLRSAIEAMEAIKDDAIDALVSDARENAVKVYTEKTADKPYRILIEKMHEGAVMLSDDGIILYCNAYFALMVNMPLEKVFGTYLIDYIEDSSKENTEELISQCQIRPANDEIIMYSGNGKKIHTLMSLTALTIDNNPFISVIITDLTKQVEYQKKLILRTKQLEAKNEELENANQELAFQIKEKRRRSKELRVAKTDVKDLEEINTHKDSVLAILSHDLRSPLAGIIGIAEMLNSDFDDMQPDEVKHLHALLLNESNKELSMLDNLLEWGRIKYASEAFSPENTVLTRSVSNVFETLKEVAANNRIQLINDVKKNIIVFADGKMVISVIQNIVSNAIKYTPAGGKITVTAKITGDKVETEIADTGTGMSKDLAEKLFTPQMTSLLTPREKNKGGGIGLLLVKDILDKNNGEIWVESEEGKGSSFYFTLLAGKSE
jgi:PAS domain S-box-containing protein